MPPRPAFPSRSSAPVGPGPRRGRGRALVVGVSALLLQATATTLPPAVAAAAGEGAAASSPAAASPKLPVPGAIPGPGPAGPPPPSPGQAAPVPALPPPLSQAEFQELLRHGSLERLAEGCQRVVEEDRLERLRRIRERLLLILPAPQPLPVVLANAEVLLSCNQPQAALTVLDRISPAAGAERLQWLLMQWRAAQAAMDHRRAALALERLGAARPARLEALLLPVLRREDGTVVSRPALDVLADHLQARGFPQAAATLLLASQEPGVIGAERRLEAVRLLQALPVEERASLLESALDQAAAVGAWSLVGELLDAQAALPSERARQRRLRLSPRIDDAYGEWLILRQDPAASARSSELERRLRSPEAKGSHREAPPPGTPPTAPSTTSLTAPLTAPTAAPGTAPLPTPSPSSLTKPVVPLP
jgi:hypothetical protein